MQVVFVTGATGCVGSNLTIELLRRGHIVRAFHRANSNTLTLQGVDVEHCIGDTHDKDSLRKAMKGCDTVFHTAAMVSFWKRKRAEQMEINVTGTQNVVEVCLELGVEKLIHTSSVAALGYRTDGQLIDETTEYNWGTISGYKYSKYLAEREVLNGVEKGLNAMIVNPSIIIGPRDVYFHGGQIVRDIKRGIIPAYVDGGINVVSVHDVVVGHILAAERGRNGERHILGGQNTTFKEFFDLVAKLLTGRSPNVKAPIWVVKGLAKFFDVFGNVTRKQPWITSELLIGIGMFNWYTIDKANRELGYMPSSIEGAIQEAYRWYRENGLM